MNKQDVDKIANLVKDEHAQMPKTCEHCGGHMKTGWQHIVMDDDGRMGDMITYSCVDCKESVTKHFYFPEDYPLYKLEPKESL